MPATLVDAEEDLEQCVHLDSASLWADRARAVLLALRRQIAAAQRRQAALEQPPKCPRHRTPLRLCAGPFGEFWGCPRFPHCHVKRDL
jgi:hypothetical protein